MIIIPYCRNKIRAKLLKLDSNVGFWFQEEWNSLFPGNAMPGLRSTLGLVPLQEVWPPQRKITTYCSKANRKGKTLPRLTPNSLWCRFNVEHAPTDPSPCLYLGFLCFLPDEEQPNNSREEGKHLLVLLSEL